ncbi:Sodium-coupled neutral amino acid transporter 2 [Durusdinium trenchii]
MKGCASHYECENIHELHSWSYAKKAWCCQHKGAGCVGSSAPSQSPGEGHEWKHEQVDGTWTWLKKVIQQHGAPPVEHGAESGGSSEGGFDCQEGLSNFVHGWANSKKHWCCAHQGVACTGPVKPTVPLQHGHQWTRVKAAEGVYVWQQVKSHVTKTYNCVTGLEDASRWTSEKRDYCCQHFNKAC